jgi:hypothetical protein
MRDKMKTKATKDLCRLRKRTVESVFGIIEATKGFRRFLTRDLSPFKAKRTPVALAYSAKRMGNLANV